jgi:hypothetical protein
VVQAFTGAATTAGKSVLGLATLPLAFAPPAVGLVKSVASVPLKVATPLIGAATGLVNKAGNLAGSVASTGSHAVTSTVHTLSFGLL